MSGFSEFISALGRSALLAAGLALAAPVSGALAQANAPYPSRTITIIAPLAAGGPTDTTARVAGEVIAKELGAQVIVENKPGAGGLLAADYVAKAAPDGYTLLLYTAGTNLLPVINKNTNIDVVKDFAPISRLIEAPTAVLINNDLPVKNMKEFLAYAKANPGKLNYGVQAASDALVIAAFNSQMGIDTQPVRYTGGAPVTQALLSNEVQFSFFFPGTAKSHIDAGKLRLLAVMDDKRFPQSPDLPTMAEEGVPSFKFVSYFGLVAPKGTPKAITDRLSAALAKGMKTGEPAARIKSLGMEVVASTPEEFGKAMDTELARWKAVADKAGIKPE